MPHAEVASLQAVLPAELLGCLQAVPGYSRAAATLAILVQVPPKDLGSELTSSFAVIGLFATVFELVNQYHTPNINLQTSASKSETHVGSSSELVGAKLRPNELFVSHMCTMMLCEDKASAQCE